MMKPLIISLILNGVVMCAIPVPVPAADCDDLEEISWRDYKPCMSTPDSLNWCRRK